MKESSKTVGPWATSARQTEAVLPRATLPHFRLHQALLRDAGHILPSHAKVLDFGCGAGAMVSEYLRQGFDAHGCDPKITLDTATLHPLPESRIPFADNTFDFIFSDQVLEHVQDHAAALAEMRRVLRPDGVTLHIFPSRWKPLESHVLVPLAGVWQNRAWLRLWASLGVRTATQRGLTAHEVAARNHEYLTTRTNYLTGRQLRQLFATFFPRCTFAETSMLQHTYGGAARLAPLARRWPIVGRLYSTFYSRVLIAHKLHCAGSP